MSYILTVGQDYTSLLEYRSQYTTHDDNDRIYMFYTDIQQVRGLYTPINYGGGIQYANGLIQLLIQDEDDNDDSNKNYDEDEDEDGSNVIDKGIRGLQIGLWLNGTEGCNNIINGQLDIQIHELLHYCLLETPNDIRIYLRIGYEFDNPSFGYYTNPIIYQMAYQYIVHQCRTIYTTNICHTNKIQFVWHSWAASILPSNTSTSDNDDNDDDYRNTTTSLSTFNDFYPGDGYVDWVGISIFSQLYTSKVLHSTGIQQLGDRTTVDYICQFAIQHNKSIMIAESTPYGGIDILHDPWNDWYIPVLQLIHQYQIQMWSYIYCDWDSIPMWYHIGFGNSRIDVINTTLNDLWIQYVVQRQQYPNNNTVPQFQSTTTIYTPTTKQLQHQEQKSIPSLSSSLAVLSSIVWSMSLSEQQPKSINTILQRQPTETSLFTHSLVLVVIVVLISMTMTIRNRLNVAFRHRTSNNNNINNNVDDDSDDGVHFNIRSSSEKEELLRSNHIAKNKYFVHYGSM